MKKIQFCAQELSYLSTLCWYYIHDLYLYKLNQFDMNLFVVA